MKEARRRVSVDGETTARTAVPEMGGGQMGDTISRDSFVIMSRKLYLYFTALRFDGYIDARECLAETERDFAHDSGGKEHIDEADFADLSSSWPTCTPRPSTRSRMQSS